MDLDMSRLQISNDYDEYDDEDSRPIFRSCPAAAFDEWDTAFTPCPDDAHAKDNQDAARETNPTMRCTPADLHQTWDFDEVASGLIGQTAAPPPRHRLTVNLIPHRVEGHEWLVSSLRQFTVSIGLVDGASGAPIPSWFSRGIDGLRATLVYADNGEPVPAQKGEAPLTGELLDGQRPHDGECHFKLRVAALSYHHARRAFAVRIDATSHADATTSCFACSQPVRAVARLPNQTEPRAAAAHAQPCTAAPTLATPAPTVGGAITDAPPAAILPARHASCPPTLARVCPPTVVVAAEPDDDGSYEDDHEMMIDDDALGGSGAGAAAAPPVARAGSFTYTSGTDLHEELKVQGDMLDRVSAQQQYILDELSRMRASRGLPAADLPGAASGGGCPLPPPGVHYRTAMCM